MYELPVVDKPTSCNNCGACCLEQESPPGYLALLVGSNWPEEKDIQRFKSLPHKALYKLKQHAKHVMSKNYQPGKCCWYDTRIQGCAFYEHRPQICRDFEIGSEACLEWRKKYKKVGNE